MFSLLDRNPLTSVVFINVVLGFNHIEKRQSYGEYSAHDVQAKPEAGDIRI